MASSFPSHSSPSHASMTTGRLAAATIAVVGSVLAACIFVGTLMNPVEQAAYTLTTSQGSIEVRSYGPMIAAETQVSGDRSLALQDGFRIMFSYIAGANQPTKRIAITAPVQQQLAPTIAMTTPSTTSGDGGRWTIRFIMPSASTIDNLPEPLNARVKLMPMQATQMAVIRFAGAPNDSQIEAKMSELRAFLAAEKIETRGAAILAFYSQPWTLPFFRRNEIMIECANVGAAG